MAEANVLAMRLGPGKHLHDRKILGGDVMDGREFGKSSRKVNSPALPC